MTDTEAILVGGPRDGTVVHPEGAALIALDTGDVTHRYVLSGQEREVDGRHLRVYTYDGEVRQDSGVVQHDTRNQG